MLEYNPSNRISAAEALKHPFFNSIIGEFESVEGKKDDVVDPESMSQSVSETIGRNVLPEDLRIDPKTSVEISLDAINNGNEALHQGPGNVPRLEPKVLLILLVFSVHTVMEFLKWSG